jgi:chromosome partitioning protein
MGRTVSFVNQKGGVGKTTVTLGLASAAAHAGHRVLVVDLDPQGGSTWVLGIDPADVEMSSAEVLTRTAAAKAIVGSSWGPAVDLIPAATRLQDREHGSGKDAGKRLRAALASVVSDYDAVLIDCPPSLGNLTTNGLAAADHAIIVVEPSALGLRGIGAIADVVDSVWDAENPDLDLAGVIVNRVPAVSSEAGRRFDELTNAVGRKSVWQPVIPQRVILNQAIGDRRSIHSFGARSADVSAVFDQLWRKLRRVIK